jgi:ABC-type dipeptide/oligopeptide/nickel transport system permease component
VYDFQSIVKAPSLIYGFAGGAPVGIWFALRQFGAPTKLISIISLYGYSLFVYIPATVRLHSFPEFITSLISSATLTTYYNLFMQLICVYPSNTLSWLSLTLATMASSIFLLRNLAPIIIAQARQQAVILICAAA